jgi:hypothetical protein
MQQSDQVLEIDLLLHTIVYKIRNSEISLPTKDKKILVSLHKQITSELFLTENQSNLLVRILKDNLTVLKSKISNIEECLTNNQWTKKFRKIEKIRKIYLSDEYTDRFLVEFNFNVRLKEKMANLISRKRDIDFITFSKYSILLTENNLYDVITEFSEENFEIDEKLQRLFKEIDKIRKNNIRPFEIFSTSEKKLKEIVKNSVGPIDQSNLLLLHDRKFRYQYEIFDKIEENSLTSKIAQRPNRKIFLNSDNFSFFDVLNSLIELKRLPLLLIFDINFSELNKNCLKLIEEAVNKTKLNGDIGIYFRHHQKDNLENFNQEIATLGYNKPLSENTVIAGICNSKLPKFMVKLNWKPQSVISFSTSFKNSKSYFYCNDVDLLLYYGNSKPLDNTIYELL